MRVLELFKGTGSIGKICKELGWDVVSLDIDKNFNPDICMDINDWDYKKKYQKGDFDIIWASPVCTYWSKIRDCWIGRKLKGMDRNLTSQDIQDDIDNIGKPMVDKTREIIDYFEPKHYFIENPMTGKMKTYITDLPYYDVSYCLYGFNYMKKTRIWTNLKNYEPLMCNPHHRCEHFRDGKHHFDVTRHVGGGGHIAVRYPLPPLLIRSLFNTINI